MNKDQHSAQDFDRIFQDKLAGHSVAPPTDMWEKVNSNTAENKKRRALFWILFSDGSTILLFLLGFMFTFGGSNVLAHLQESTNPINQNSISVQNANMSSVSRPVSTAIISQIGTQSTLVTNIEPDAANIDSKTTLMDSFEVDHAVAETVSKVSGNYTDKSTRSTHMGSSESSAGKSNLENDLESISSEDESEEDPTNRLVSQDGEANDQYDAATTSPKTVDKDDEASFVDFKSGQQLTITERPRAKNQKESFKLQLIDVIEPDLRSEVMDDSLRKIAIPELPKDLVGTPDHEVFVGVHANFNLPLIFNQNTYGAFDGKELAYKPNFGMASGIRLGYTYKRQYGIQTGFIFYSRQGQNYEDKLNGKVAKRQVKLQYLQVPLIARYKFKIKKEQRFESPWVINLGAQIGILRSAEITYTGNEYPLGLIANPEVNDKDYFKPIDISVVLGVEKEFYFTKWLMLSVGMRTTFSGDINANDHPVMNDGSNYDKSHNFTFGFTLGLNYYLRR